MFAALRKVSRYKLFLLLGHSAHNCRVKNGRHLGQCSSLLSCCLISLSLPTACRWFTSGFESGDNVWTWEGDNAQFSNIENLWLPQQDVHLWKYVSYK